MGDNSTNSKRFRAHGKDDESVKSKGSVDFTSVLGSVPTGSMSSGAFGLAPLGVVRRSYTNSQASDAADHKTAEAHERSFLATGNFQPNENGLGFDAVESSRDKVFAFIDSKFFQVVTTMFTVFALWGDDYRLCCWHKQSDSYFHVFYAMTFLIFAIELTLHSIVTEEYKWSFFFCLDMLATVSLLGDIPWVMDPIMSLYGDSTGMVAGGAAARTSRASRAGTKTGRIVRIVRLVRLLRLVNLSGKCGRAPKTDLDTGIDEQTTQTKEEKQVKASRLGKMLSEQTTRTVIIGVLCTLIVLPFIGEDNPSLVSNLTFGFALENIFWFGLSSCTTVEEFQKAQDFGLPVTCTNAEAGWISPEGYQFMLYEFAQSSRIDEDSVRHKKVFRPLLSLKVPDIGTAAVGVNGSRIYGSSRWVARIDTARCSQDEKFKDDQESDFPFQVLENYMPTPSCSPNTCCWEPHATCWDLSDDCPWRDSELARVSFTPPGCDVNNWDHKCNSFHIKAIYLNRYKTETEAVFSLLQTTFIVILLGTGAMMFANDTQIFVINPIEKMVNIVKQLADNPLNRPDVVDDGELKPKSRQRGGKGQLETSMLENTILKIGSLLQVGFGEAGAQIIGKNMASQDGELNILSPGRKIVGIFGFCDIREFMETTECLLEEVMVFVNKIARIVHICVHAWSGAANKNIGDSFLVTWIVNDPEEQNLMVTIGYEHSHKNCELADKALIAFLKIIAELRRASDLSAYARHPKIIPKFGMDYHVNMGFGLHVGWAIEGAIGSEHKIDASYLSPHVNMCARLETATRQYDIHLLFSQALYQIIAQKGRDRCRKIDVVMLKGSLQPMGIFTFDVNDEVPSTPEGHDVGQVIPPAEITSESLRAKGVDWTYILDQDIIRLQEGITLDFQNTWRQAFHYYINGKWGSAKELFIKCSAQMPYGDGPSECLMNFINQHDCIPPDDWAGCRALSSK